MLFRFNNISILSLTQNSGPSKRYEFPNETLVLLDFNVVYHVINGETFLEMRFKLWDFDVIMKKIHLYN